MTQEWKSKEKESKIISKANGWSLTWIEKSTRKRWDIYNRRKNGTSVFFALVSFALKIVAWIDVTADRLGA
jgi:hypothetical protein